MNANADRNEGRRWPSLKLPPADRSAVEALSLGACAAGMLSLPAALAGPERSLGLWLAVGVGASGAAAWVLSSSRRAAWAGHVLAAGLSAVLGVAVIAAVGLAALWAALVGAVGLLSLAVAWLWGRSVALLWGGGEVALWALTLYMNRTWMDWHTATLTLILLLAANGLAWLLCAPGGAHQSVWTAAGAASASVASNGSAAALAAQIEHIVRELDMSATTIQGVTAEQLSGVDQLSEHLARLNEALAAYQQAVEQTRTLAQQMAHVTQETVSHSDQGQQVAARALLSLEDIRSQVKAIALNLGALARHTERIGEIISSLGDLATQSNFLALNASIEAARAGQHGRGFAVVAAEVRDLAQQSAEASAQVRNILVEIRQAVQQSAAATEAGAEGVDAGVAKVTESAHMVGRVAAHSSQVTSTSQRILAGLQDQMQELTQLEASLRQINETQMQHAANARLAEAIADNLHKLSAQLRAVAAEIESEEVVV